MALMFFLCLSSGVQHLIVAPQHTHYCYSYTIHRTKERGYILPASPKELNSAENGGVAIFTGRGGSSA